MQARPYRYLASIDHCISTFISPFLTLYSYTRFFSTRFGYAKAGTLMEFRRSVSNIRNMCVRDACLRQAWLSCSRLLRETHAAGGRPHTRTHIACVDSHGRPALSRDTRTSRRIEFVEITFSREHGARATQTVIRTGNRNPRARNG